MKKPVTLINKTAVSVRNISGRVLPLKISAVSESVVKIFQALHKPLISTNILFFSDKQIILLNKKYLNAYQATDVISFGYPDGKLCDIAISLDTARRNASIYKTTYKNEVVLYIIHGILHICGYDDKTSAEKKIMFKKQKKIFQKI